MENKTATKIEKARIIVWLEELRQSYLDQFNQKMQLAEVASFMSSQGNGELKLLIDKIKTDLLQLESKLEDLL